MSRALIELFGDSSGAQKINRPTRWRNLDISGDNDPTFLGRDLARRRNRKVCLLAIASRSYSDF